MPSKLLLKRPLATQCVTSAILFASGDIIAQQAIQRKRAKHDVCVTKTHRLASLLNAAQLSFNVVFAHSTSHVLWR
jgi:hypothetical protein